MKELVVAGLLLASVSGALLSSAGLLLFRDVFARLHFAGPVSILSPTALALAVLCDEGLSPASLRAALTAFVLVVGGPVLTHAAARAAMLRGQGRWNPFETTNERGARR